MTDQLKTNATLANLRTLAGLIASDVPLRPEAVSEAIMLCVSEWEADRKRLAALREASLRLASWYEATLCDEPDCGSCVMGHEKIAELRKAAGEKP